jgi:hypothetical protein
LRYLVEMRLKKRVERCTGIRTIWRRDAIGK